MGIVLMLVFFSVGMGAQMADDRLPVGADAAQVQAFLSDDPVIRRVMGLIPPMSNKVIAMKRSALHPAVQKGLSPDAAAFHTPGSTDITVLTDSPMYQQALAGGADMKNQLADYLLAGALVHEKRHDTATSEIEPYQDQLKFLQTYVPTNSADGGDQQKMQAVIKRYQQILDQLQKGDTKLRRR